MAKRKIFIFERYFLLKNGYEIKIEMSSETSYYSYYVSKRHLNSLYRKPITKITSKDGFKKREVQKKSCWKLLPIKKKF